MGDTTIPSDSNGVYSLPSGYLAVTGEVIQASQHNPVLEDLGSSMSARLMRSGAAPMTGPLKIADGSVGSPGIQFASDASDGLYKTANGIGVSVNGTKVAEFTSSGLSRIIGELIPWTLLSAPSGWVLPYGQTLSRTTYAALWVIAQTEIAGGNTFYNNGDGSTTFGVGDVRGRVVAGKDNMGGATASRLSFSFGASNIVLGATNGQDSQTLTTLQMPPHTHDGTTGVENQSLAHSHGFTAAFNSGSGQPGGVAGALGSNASLTTGSASPNNHNHNFTTSSSGSGTAHNNVQPTIVCNYILFAGA